MEFLGQLREGARVTEPREPGHCDQISRYPSCKGAGDVRLRYSVRLEDRLGSTRGKRAPRFRGELSRVRQIVRLLEGSQGAPITVAVYAVDFARREVRPVEERLRFCDQGGIRIVIAMRRSSVHHGGRDSGC